MICVVLKYYYIIIADAHNRYYISEIVQLLRIIYKTLCAYNSGRRQ